MKFLVISDLHYGRDELTNARPIEAFIRKIESIPDLAFSAVTGDLTDNGFDGVVSNPWLVPLMGANTILTGGSTQNQVAMFKTRFADRVVRLSKTKNNGKGAPFYFIAGNHDQYNGASRYPINEMVVKWFGGMHYYRIIDNVLLLFCSIYPDKHICGWLEKLFRKEVDVVGKKLRVAVFFHYNLKDEYSDWWTEDEKERFYGALAPIRAHVLAIFVGHFHSSYAYKWKDFDVFSTGGKSFASCEIDRNGKLNVEFCPTL